MTAILILAASTGLVGSLHCAAMCGPLAIAGCGTRRDTLGYFGGRAAAYTMAGALLGHLGHHALCVLPASTVQTIALLLAAAFAAWRAIGPHILRARERPLRIHAARPRRFSPAALIPRRGLGLGIATGFLPCGMLAAAWMLAAGTASAPRGALVMLVYSLASLPGLLVPVFGRRLASPLLRRLPPQAHSIAWGLLALWLAARPLLAGVHHHH